MIVGRSTGGLAVKLALGFVASFFALAVSGAILSFFLIAPITTAGRISWEEATFAIVPAAAAVAVFLALVLRLGGKAKAITAGRSETGDLPFGRDRRDDAGREARRYRRRRGLRTPSTRMDARRTRCQLARICGRGSRGLVPRSRFDRFSTGRARRPRLEPGSPGNLHRLRSTPGLTIEAPRRRAI